ncbi:MAG: hypothetical protein V2A54_08060 [Bacteroidota bacterium]
MKTISTFLLAALMLACSVARSQDKLSSATDSTGLPGDHFSLQGALEMFKTSKSLEEFEKKLNTESNYVNNLDLDGDGKTDYITVSDEMEGTSHAIILRVYVTEKESQDVAVIEIEKSGNESAQLQIVGDVTLYGDSTILEPVEVSTEGGKGGVGGPSPIVVKQSFFFVNVWYWPCIMFLYTPVYTPWYSPWYYGYYPYWYSPWYHHPWYYHHHHCHHWHNSYHHSYYYKMNHAHGIYGHYRKASPIVEKKYAPAHLAYKANKAGKPIGSVKSTPVNNQGKPNTNQGKGNSNDQGKPNTNDQGKGNPNNQGKPNTNDQVKPNTNDQGKGNPNNQGKPNTNQQGKGNSDNQIKGNQNSNSNQGKGNTYTPSKGNSGNNGNQGKGNSYQGKGKSGNQNKGSVSPKSSRPSSPKSSGSSRGGSSGGKRGGR